VATGFSDHPIVTSSFDAPKSYCEHDDQGSLAGKKAKVWQELIKIVHIPAAWLRMLLRRQLDPDVNADSGIFKIASPTKSAVRYAVAKFATKPIRAYFRTQATSFSLFKNKVITE
jgi:hypothetical protein